MDDTENIAKLDAVLLKEIKQIKQNMQTSSPHFYIHWDSSDQNSPQPNYQVKYTTVKPENKDITQDHKGSPMATKLKEMDWHKQMPEVNKPWSEVYPEIDTNVDVLQAIADFYLLEALISGAMYEIPKNKVPTKQEDEAFFAAMGITSEKEKAEWLETRNKNMGTKINPLVVEANNRMHDLVEKLDTVFSTYALMAIGGELRHHGSVNFIGDRSMCWSAFREIYEETGPILLEHAVELFLEFKEGSSFGGKPWANCAQVLHDRLTGTLGPDGPDGHINKKLFLDRLWTLEHNGGAFINKVSWVVNNSFGYDLSQKNIVLDAHASDPPKYSILIAFATKPVKELVEKFDKEFPRLYEKSAKTTKICGRCHREKHENHPLYCHSIVKNLKNGEGYIEINEDIFDQNTAILLQNNQKQQVNVPWFDGDGNLHPDLFKFNNEKVTLWCSYRTECMTEDGQIYRCKGLKEASNHKELKEMINNVAEELVEKTEGKNLHAHSVLVFRGSFHVRGPSVDSMFGMKDSKLGVGVMLETVEVKESKPLTVEHFLTTVEGIVQ